jgi:hypothetical protein
MEGNELKATHTWKQKRKVKGTEWVLRKKRKKR